MSDTDDGYRSYTPPHAHLKPSGRKSSDSGIMMKKWSRHQANQPPNMAPKNHETVSSSMTGDFVREALGECNNNHRHHEQQGPLDLHCTLSPPTLPRSQEGPKKQTAAAALTASASSAIVNPSTLAFREGGGCSFRLSFDGWAYWLAAELCGKPVRLRLSSTRRSLTVSTQDAGRWNLAANQQDIVCSYPHKKVQVYRAPVTLHREEQSQRITMARYQFHVADGDFESRIGLLGDADHAHTLYSHLRLKSCAFALLLTTPKPWLLLGSDVKVPPQAWKVDLSSSSSAMDEGRLPFQLSKKELLMAGCRRVFWRSKSSSSSSAHHEAQPSSELNAWSGPAVLTIEQPRICLPMPLWKSLMRQLQSTIDVNLLKGQAISLPDRVSSLRHWPSLVIQLDDVLLSVEPEHYMAPNEGAPHLHDCLIVPHNAPRLIVLGNCAFRDINFAVDDERQRMWLWN